MRGYSSRRYCCDDNLGNNSTGWGDVYKNSRRVEGFRIQFYKLMVFPRQFRGIGAKIRSIKIGVLACAFSSTRKTHLNSIKWNDLKLIHKYYWEF